MAEEKSTIYRLSVCRMYYAISPKAETPLPFSECRAFIFLKERPTRIMEEGIKTLLREAIDRMMPFFFSLVIAEESGKAFYEEESKTDDISVTKRKGKMKIEIDGYEIEEVSVEDILEYMKRTEQRIIFNQIYRYVRFDFAKRPSREYLEEEIKELEEKS
jgi:hypothetical protein